MDPVQMQSIVDECHYPHYEFLVEYDERGAIFLQGHYVENDVLTRKPEVQHTRKWFLSPKMVKSEVVQTVFKCVMTSMEHRVREWFRYRGRAIFGPHFDVDSLHAICKDEHLDYRNRVL